MSLIIPPRDQKQATVLFNRQRAKIKTLTEERDTALYSLKEKDAALLEKEKEIENLLSVIDEYQAKEEAPKTAQELLVAAVTPHPEEETVITPKKGGGYTRVKRAVPAE